MINYSVNTHITNKATKAHMEILATGFTPVKTDIETLSAHIINGHAILAGVLKPDASGSYIRNNDNWESSELIILDIDNSVKLPGRKDQKRMKTEEEGYLPLQRFINNEFIKNHCFLIYTSVSHTPDWNRFRIIFRLPKMIDNYQVYKQLLMAFIVKFDTDRQCSAPSNTFYGNTNSEIFTFGKSLEIKHLEEVLAFDKNINQAETDFKTANINGQLTPDIAREMLHAIPSRLDYIDWMRVVSGIASKFDEDTSVELLEEWSPGYEGEVRYKVRKRLRTVGMGTVIYMARQCGWEPPLGFYKEKKNPGDFALTDLGNAERFVEQVNGLAKYEHNSKLWFIYDGKRYKQSDTGEQFSLAKKVVRGIYAESQKIDDTDKRKLIAKWAIQSEARKKMLDMISLAGNLPELAVTFEYFDTKPTLVNLNNCLFDLEKYLPYEHSPEVLNTKLIPVDFIENAECPHWINFLKRIFKGDIPEGKRMMIFIQRAVGYSLSALISEQCLFFAYGIGKNGKTIFFRTIEMLFGDYFQKAPTEMLLAKKQEVIPIDVARLRGARFVVTAELPENKRFDEAKLKDLTGGDTITARVLYGNLFNFSPTHKLWIYGNHKPTINGTDEGIWRRIKIIPFTEIIPENERRPQEDMIAEFQSEMPGILKWALEGFYLWKNDGGLKTPKEVEDATEVYRHEMDVIGTFVDQSIVKKEGKQVKFTEVYESYLKWAERNGEYALKSRAFNTKMKERGYENKVGDGNYTYWTGIQLIGQESAF